MSQIIEVKVPDIGDYKDVPVIEVAVKAGDKVVAEDTLVTLESDKATMDVPSPAAGVVKEVRIKVGDTVSEGALVLLLDTNADAQAAAPVEAGDPAKVAAPADRESVASQKPESTEGASGRIEVKVPDIGDYKDVPVIEVYVKPGDTVHVDDTLMTLESDKATMDVPSTVAGTVQSVLVKVGDAVSEGSVIVTLTASGTGQAPLPSVAQPVSQPAAPAGVGEVARQSVKSNEAAAKMADSPATGGQPSHASPSVRKFARTLGVDVGRVKGSGPKGRITQQDVEAYVKGVMSGTQATPAASAQAGGITGGGELNLLPWPKVDFAKFGPIESKPLSRIKKISAANLARNWVMIPAVTYHEDADITELEAFRVQLNKENEKSGAKVTMLAFLIKAAVAALKKFPEFNSSLDGENLVMKQYYHVAFAADTPNGLVVPVVKDADKKGIFEIARETGELAKLARDGKLKPDQMQGACFTISSLGGIGGTYFAPIINAPEVAILGVNKSAMKPVWDPNANGGQFVPRLTLPLSLTADHRVIDGALATRFNVYLAQLLADFRRVML